MLRAADKWFPGYVRSVMRRPGRVTGTRHLIFCIADHFEPFRRVAGADGLVRASNVQDARALVAAWGGRYPAEVSEFRDSDGRMPCHTFFYPQEEYDPACLDCLARLSETGYGEVEIHLHHRHDTADGLREKLCQFRDILHSRHGLLGTWRRGVGRGTWNVERRTLDVERGKLDVEHGKLDEERGAWKEEGEGGSGVSNTQQSIAASIHSPTPPIFQSSSIPGSVAYGFVHGNWALCNSRPDGDWCGVNEELGILSETGCYADLTFPSAPSPTQPRMVNCIYRASDNPGRPRGCDSGVRMGSAVFHHSTLPPFHSSNSLLLITGPLGLNWRSRKWGVLPRLENAEISAANRPSPARADLWVRQGIHVGGRPEWVFVKVHTHGCLEANREVLLGEGMRSLRRHLHARYNDGQAWKLHYVSAREMYNIARAAEDGMSGNPGEYRDYEVAPPPVIGRGR